MKNTPAKLRPFEDARLAELMGWFPDRIACQTWGGLEFRFPFTAQTFREDAKLGRLAVAPQCHGQGLGSALVNELCARGRVELGVASCSLFVVPENTRALALYERRGFKAAPYPEPAPGVDRHIYMITEPAVD